jgi:hypothetical protein
MIKHQKAAVSKLCAPACSFPLGFPGFQASLLCQVGKATTNADDMLY